MSVFKKILAVALVGTLVAGLSMSPAAAAGTGGSAAKKLLGELAIGESVERGMYTVDRRENDVWHIEDSTAENPAGIHIDASGSMTGMNNCSDMYVVLGEEKAMLVDLSNPFPDNWTDIQGIFDEIAGEREQLVWVTHWHGDHTGQFGAFKDSDIDIYIAAEDLPSLDSGMQARVTAFNAAEDTIDLGGRTFKCVLVPGHTDGSNVLYEEATKIGFSGDTVGSGNGIWLFGDFPEYESGLKALLKVIDNDLGGEIKLYGGHTWQQTGTGEYVEMDRQYVEDMLAIVENIRNGGEYKLEQYLYGSMGLDTNVSYGKAIITVAKSKVVGWGLAGNLIINPFEDIADRDTADAVARLFAKGIVKGTSYSKFNPDAALSRAEFMTFLGRCAGAQVDQSAKSEFTDVKNDGWSSGYIAWGVENGLVQGYGNGAFNQYGKLTKEHCNLIIGRYNEKFGCEIKGYEDETGYATRATAAEILSAAFAAPERPAKVPVKDLDMSKYTAWGAELDPDDYVSFAGSYPSGTYLDLFEERTFKNEDTEEKNLTTWGESYTQAVGDITYYVYDPIAHGADPDKTYPVIYWFHGSGNALNGKFAVPASGAEHYASPEYQEQFGGAYIVCPLANEYNTEAGQTRMNWLTTAEGETTSAYSTVLKQLMDGFMEENKEHLNGSLVLAGTSAGGFMGWRYMLDYTEDVKAAMLMAPAYLPTEEELDKVNEAGINIWCISAKHDELVKYDENILPIRDKLLEMENFELTELEWVRNGDKGVASMFFGIEMGQHCVCVQVSNNLIYDDGTPYDEAHPQGVTAWFAKVLA